MISLTDIKNEFRKYLLFKDENIIDLALATILGNVLLEKSRIWLLLVGSSGSGKTSIVDPLRNVPLTYFLDDISPNAFLSGYMGGKQSLLQKITFDPVTKTHKPKTIVFSDFTTILSKNQEARGEGRGRSFFLPSFQAALPRGGALNNQTQYHVLRTIFSVLS